MTLGNANPFRYRGYYYDSETGFYYLGGRYYDPEICRFINADDIDLLLAGQMALSDKNLFAYCYNNPAARKDSEGKFWLTTFAVGVAAQYVGDVIKNITSGKKGADVLKPTSSVGKYLAAGITALIPGSGFGASFVRNVVAESITSAENYIKGKGIDVKKSFGNVIKGTVADVLVEKATDKISEFITSKAPQNYSSYAGQQYKKNPKITKERIIVKARRATRWNNVLNQGITFAINSFRNAMTY